MPAKQNSGASKTVTSRKLPAAGPAQEEQQEHEEQAASGGQSRADLFRNAAKAEGFNFPPGQYTAILNDCSVLRDGEKETVMWKYEVNDGGEQDGKTVCAFYNFFNEDGEQQRGMEFFKKDIETLEEDVDAFVESYCEGSDSFDDRLRILAEERKECVIDVKQTKGQKGTFTNVYLQGLSQS